MHYWLGFSPACFCVHQRRVIEAPKFLRSLEVVRHSKWANQNTFAQYVVTRGGLLFTF